MTALENHSSRQALVPTGESLVARALFIGERLDVRKLGPSLGAAPRLVEISSGAWAVLQRYGAIVLFNVDARQQAAVLAQLRPLLREPYDAPEEETVEVIVDAEAKEGVDDEQRIVLHEATVARLQVVGEVLSKSVFLAQYETLVASVFDKLEPLVADLERWGRGWGRAKQLLQQISLALQIEHKIVGRVEVTEKPELLWEQPELERLYLRLEDEYELRERDVALGRKLRLVSDTASSALGFLQTKRSLRLEWYIVVLIVVEILLTLYELFVRHRG